MGSTAKLVAVASLALVAAACATVLGFEDGALDPNRADAGTSGASGNGGNGGDGGDGGNGDAAGVPDCGAPLGTSDNCAACGHTCLGTACIAGRCAPVVLKTGLDHPLSLAVGATDLYVALGADTVARYSKNGGAEVRMTGGASAGGAPQRVVTADGFVYWSAYQSGVYRCPAGGCPGAGPAKVAIDDNGPTALGVRGGRLAWVDRITGEVVLADEGDGAARIAIAASGNPAELTTDATYAYVTETSPDDVLRVRLDDGGVTGLLGVPSPPAGIVVAAGTAYVALRSRGSEPSGMYAIPLDGAAPAAFGKPKSRSALAVTTDGTFLYWTDEGVSAGPSSFVPGTSCIWRCRLGECATAPPVEIACNLDDANGIGVDEAAIYWIEFGDGDPATATGRLRKIAKPPP